MEHITEILRTIKKQIVKDEPYYSLVQNIPEKGLILDAGAGDGKYARILHNAERTIICLDIERPKTMNPDHLYILGSIEYLPFKKELFESIHCLSVIQYVKNDQAIFVEFHRILKLDGILLLTLPTKYSMFHLLRELEIYFNIYHFSEYNVPHNHYYSRREIKHLSSILFSEVKIKGYYFNFFPRLIMLIWNVLKKYHLIRSESRTVEKNTNIEHKIINNQKEYNKNHFFVRTYFFLGQIFKDFAYHYIVVLRKDRSF